jgi:hypothetical protein
MLFGHDPKHNLTDKEYGEEDIYPFESRIPEWRTGESFQSEYDGAYNNCRGDQLMESFAVDVLADFFVVDHK